MEKKKDLGISGGVPRRDFIKKPATAAAAVATTSLFRTPVYGQNQAPSPGHQISGPSSNEVTSSIGPEERR